MERGALFLWHMRNIKMCSSVVSQAVRASPSGDGRLKARLFVGVVMGIELHECGTEERS